MDDGFDDDTTVSGATLDYPTPSEPAPPVATNGHGAERRPFAAPVSDWSEMSASDHLVQFYEADAFLLDGVAEYIRGALNDGGAGVVIATKLHRDGLDDRLATAGTDIAAARREGRYVTLDAFDTLSRFMVDGAPDRARFDDIVGGLIADALSGGRRVRAFGGMVALLVADGNYDATLQLEALWNDLLDRLPFSLFCAYPMDHAGGEALTTMFHSVSDAHTRVIPAESYTALPTNDDRLRAIVALQQKARWLEREIVERRQAEERLRVALAAEQAARREAEVALRLRDEFLSIAAHELKTPLTSLTGHAQLAQRQLQRDAADTARVAQSLEIIDGQTRRLARLVNQLLDVSRLEAGKLRLERREVDLAALAGDVVAALQIDARRHPVRLEIAPGLTVNGDPLRLEQALTNLLENAVKYSPDGGEIVVRATRPTPETVEIAVRDHGLGIPVESRERIFDRYYQAHGESHGGAYAGGLGLGLYITRQIIELHGGQLRAEHPHDGGVRMVVTI